MFVVFEMLLSFPYNVLQEFNANKILYPGSQFECQTKWNSWSQIQITKGPFYLHGLALIPAWISNYIHYKVWWDYLSILKLE